MCVKKLQPIAAPKAVKSIQASLIYTLRALFLYVSFLFLKKAFSL